MLRKIKRREAAEELISTNRAGIQQYDNRREGRTFLFNKPAVHRQTLTADEAAQMLGISRGSVYKAIHNGELPTIRIGGRALILRDAFMRLLRDGLEGTSASRADQREATP
jgi:excisionase family DNA binding protein